MITDAAYSACKAIGANPLRNRLRDTLGGLHTVQEGSTVPGRSELAYRARKVRHQALGYLLVDQSADEIPELFNAPIPHLLANERALLAQFHSELVDLNTKCVATAVASAPSIRIAVDPYSEFVQPIGEGLAGERFISDPIVNALVAAFRSHPGVQLVANGLIGRIPAMSDVDILKNVLSLRQLIATAGLANAPSQLQHAVFATPRDDPRRIFVKGFASLLAVRTSLHNLNQMLFQAIEMDKPPVLDADNIIQITNAHTILSGPSVSVTYQPDDITLFVDPGDLMLLKEVPNAVPVSGLTSVNDTHFEHSRDYGAINRVGLRILNSWLSPYGNLETLL